MLLCFSNSLGWVIVVLPVIIARFNVKNFTEQTLTVRCKGTVTDCATFPTSVEANAYDSQETIWDTKKNSELLTSILIPNGTFLVGFSGTLGEIGRAMSYTNC